MTRIYGEGGLPDETPRHGSDWSFIDSTPDELHDGALRSDSILLVNHIHHILLGQFNEYNSEELSPLIKAVSRRERWLREQEMMLGIESAKAISVAERLSAPPELNNRNHERIADDALRTLMIEKLKPIAQMYYDASDK